MLSLHRLNLCIVKMVRIWVFTQVAFGTGWVWLTETRAPVRTQNVGEGVGKRIAPECLDACSCNMRINPCCIRFRYDSGPSHIWRGNRSRSAEAPR